MSLASVWTVYPEALVSGAAVMVDLLEQDLWSSDRVVDSFLQVVQDRWASSSVECRGGSNILPSQDDGGHCGGFCALGDLQNTKVHFKTPDLM